ncbi:MAG: phage Gp37/Gp68 family protein [Treponema sp.]|nr:phage Gp37/Gp68 family protein [Treponema sp.]
MNKSAGDMYGFVTHTWNPVKGKCGYGCSYCYVKKIARRFGKGQGEPRLDEKELGANLGTGKNIFVCSSCDLFHDDVPRNWIWRCMERAHEFPGNKYLWHTKNPRRALDFQDRFGGNDTLCVTIESDIHRPEMSAAPSPMDRFSSLQVWAISCDEPWMLTMEPVLDFNIEIFRGELSTMMPAQVNIGADSGGNGLPEPSAEKLRELIAWLEPRTKVVLKKNLARLLPEMKEGAKCAR